MKKILLIICIILLMSCLYKVKSKELVIPSDAIRLRILANSNSEYDQRIKMKVSIELQNKLYNMLKETKGVEEARKIIKENINLLNDDIGNLLKNENYNKTYKISFGNNYFPQKQYKGTTYDEGYYESLLITLGSGEGDNWWCVLFPPLCLMEAEETTENKVEYKSFVQELINKYL